jgi:1-aminocyclopropane-1-carboxylate deaminase
LAGLVKYAKIKPERSIQGVAVLKQADYLLPQIKQWIGDAPHNHWALLETYHGGGYGKRSNELMQFKQTFETHFKIPLDPVYTVKMMNAFYQELQLGHIKKGAKVILLHTGGLQGNR